ncbi:tetratricopeptide repeat protein [Limnoraphis robusta CCNP1315]|uniref:Tetratricopeptide repeat protein n=2 Tax=Limnoraphis TaxID=1332112 RepID=A0ABU5U9M1_9CYAN|nr:tetratricopeptide repeat protein [Limnoraphis robusta]MEA5522808.1 tetratricopeptide repeat protein [Limnoraphis robusta CCNP1315]MEA5549010.1 tetratricopeptide repeat protein [Limnoraphis robusta CCNP1324]
MMEHSVLEEIFVQRHSQVEELIESIRSSVVSREKQHILLTGSRGIGKTHLVSLIYHRIREREELQKQLFIAWLSEEEWSITSFMDFLICIFNTLQVESIKTDQPCPPSIESLYEISVDAMEKEALVLLKEFIGDRTLLLIVENLDELLNGLDSNGQKQLRSFIEENSCVMLATASSLPNAVKRKSATFYQFFNHQELEGLKLEDARDLLAKIAKLKGNKELEDFIKEPTGFNRIKAVYHLAGGNHRLYVIFSEFLTHRNSLDQLVEAFLRTLDDLTPYYQDRMRSISPQQRKIIEFLCKTRTAVTVKEIAQRCFMTHQTASSQLKKLSEMGYVCSKMYGRESYYEVKETMMRFCLEAKKQQGEPIKLFVDFLRIWFTQKELKERLELLPFDDQTERDYLTSALSKIQDDTQNLLAEKYDKDCRKYFEDGDFESALNLAQELIKIRGYAEDWFAHGLCLLKLNRKEEALKSMKKASIIEINDEETWFIKGLIFLNFINSCEDAIHSFDRAIEINKDNFLVWYYRGLALTKINSFQDALISFNRAIRLNPENSEVWQYRGLALIELERYEEALASFNKAIELDDQYVSLWQIRGQVLYELKRYEEALASFNKAIELDDQDILLWQGQGQVLYELERYEEALASFNKAIELDFENIQLWNNRGRVLYELGDYEGTLISLKNVIKLDPEHFLSWEIKGMTLYVLKHYEEALQCFDKVIELSSNHSDALFRKAELLVIMNRWTEGFEILDLALNTLEDLSEPENIATGIIVKNLFKSTNDLTVWRTRIQTLIDIYDKHKASSILGQEIVLSIESMTDMVGEKAAQAWLEIWKEIVGDSIDFQIPLRLLEAAVRYRKTKGDPRVLLRLPIEERKLLMPLLGLEESD